MDKRRTEFFPQRLVREKVIGGWWGVFLLSPSTGGEVKIKKIYVVGGEGKLCR